MRCESQDLALVPDLDGDGLADVVGVDARRASLVLSLLLRYSRSAGRGIDFVENYGNELGLLLGFSV